MSVSALMALGTRAMAANYATLQTTGNNIANANTPGYSRQSVDLETAGGQFTGAGYFGHGVNVTTVTRAHSDFLTREAAAARSVAAADDVRSTQMQQLEKAFPTGEAGVGYAAGQLFNAFVDVATTPQDSSARQSVLGATDELAGRFASAGKQIDAIQTGVTADLKTSVASVNSLTQRIASLNQQIAATKGSGHEPNDLLDQRDSALDELSQYVQVSTVPASDGTLSVFLQGGQRLVLGAHVGTLAAMTDPFDAAKVQIGMTEGAVTRALPEGYLTAGSIAGLLRFQSNDLVDARNLLGQMASAITGSVNTRQALGLDLSRPPGAGAPLLSVGAPVVAPASDNATVAGVAVASYLDATGQRKPSVGLTILDASQLQASDYRLDADTGTGSYRLTRLSDGLERFVADGSSVDGFRIDVGNPPPAAGDRFLLQPVGAAARNMQRVLDTTQGIAAAAPVVATTSVDNRGTMTVASLAAVAPALNPNLTATLTFTDANGAFAYSLVDATGALPPSSGTGTWKAGQPIAINGWQLQLAGVPRSGDALTVTKTPYPAGDNGNAQAMLALGTSKIVGQTLQTDGILAGGTTVTDAYADAIADIGVRVQTASAAADQSAVVAKDAKTEVATKAGVNLDEEAARLIQFQQSYQAAAKMLQVAQSVFDSLLQIAAR